MTRGLFACNCGFKFPPRHNACSKCGIPDWACDVVPANPLDFIYDLETYPNFFTFLFKHVQSGEFYFFEISDRINQSNELYQFLFDAHVNRSRHVGYNNIHFDYPIIHHFINIFKTGVTLPSLFQKVEQIINASWDDRYKHLIWDNEMLIPQVDLFKLNHLDYKTKRTSLKTLEFNMQSDNIEDLPFKPGFDLNDEQKDMTIEYQYHDVNETEKFYFESLAAIELREDLSKKYNKNFINHDDTKIGKDIFVMKLEKLLPGSCYTRVNGRRTARGTPRPQLPLSSVIFPYVQFNQRPFQLVTEWLKNKTITQTKGVFEFCEVSPEMAQVMDPTLIKVHGLPSGKPELLSKCINQINFTGKYKFISGWKNKSGLNCYTEGFKYVFGTGGIHGSIHSKAVYSDFDYVIYDWDVASYYPNLAIVNRLYPEHLSEDFCEVYNDFYQERKQYPKGTPENLAIKLGLNSVYGNSNNRYAPFYDPKYAMATTINGQLLLCMLAENLIRIPNLQMIQINTDGLTVRCPRTHVDAMKNICGWWEKFTCLTLESAIYNRMFIRDVNNYIAEYENGGVKRKGAYEYKLEWHKDHSQIVVAKAAEAFLINGVQPEYFIYSHKNHFDFMLCGKVKGNDKLTLGDQVLSKTTRYYVSTNGAELTKVSPPSKGYQVGQWKRASGVTNQFYTQVVNELKARGPQHGDLIDSVGLPWDSRINSKNESKYEIRKTSLNSGYLVSVCNNIKDFDKKNIDYQYYIDETYKLINPIINGE